MTRPSSAILIAASGSGAPDAATALKSFTAAARAAFPGFPVRLAFSARQQAGHEATDITDALSRFAREGASFTAIQPLHIINGRERAALCETVAGWSKHNPGMNISIGSPLLADKAALRAALEAMETITLRECGPNETPVWVGHGSPDPDTAYARLARLARERTPQITMGYLTGGEEREDILARLLASGVRPVALIPFFSLYGRHPANDVHGGCKDSWLSCFSRAGIRCRVVARGLAEHEEFAAMWLARLKKAVTG